MKPEQLVDAQLQALEPDFPPMVARKAVKWITGGGISPKTMAHDDSHGKGPKSRMIIAGQIYYARRDFLDYLKRKGMAVIAVPEI